MTWRGFLARIGLAPVRDILRQRKAYFRLIERSHEREESVLLDLAQAEADLFLAREEIGMLRAENAAVRAENANLKRAALDERLHNDDWRGESVVALHRLHARLPNTADDPPPFGREWHDPELVTAVDCLEGDNPNPVSVDGRRCSAPNTFIPSRQCHYHHSSIGTGTPQWAQHLRNQSSKARSSTSAPRS